MLEFGRASNVETVFSGAGKFTEEAKNTRPTLLRRMVKLHYDWKYEFLRPSIKQVEARYLEKWPRGTASQTAAAAKRATQAVAAAAAANKAGTSKGGAAEAVDAEEAAAVGGEEVPAEA